MIPGFYNDSMRTASALRHREGSQRAVQEFVERPHGFSQSYDLTDDFCSGLIALDVAFEIP